MALNCRTIGKRVLFLFITLTFLVIVTSNLIYIYINRPGPLSIRKVLIIPSNSSIKHITKLLAQENIIEYPLIFQIVTYGYGYFYTLKAGEYAFDIEVTPRQILKKLIEGRYLLHSITFPEGLTVKQIIALLNSEDLLRGPIKEDIKEGSLFPDTYFFYYNEQRQHIIDNMQKKMRKVLEELWEKRDFSENWPIRTIEELVILASIVEKETSIKEEQKRIAAVFINRLQKGMKLQADPTVIYAISEKLGYLGRPLIKKDLEQISEYNTYINFGLPPSPIANPGKTALEAALSPLDTNELFFVADPDNMGHKFTEKLSEHIENVIYYRDRLKQSQQNKANN